MKAAAQSLSTGGVLALLSDRRKPARRDAALALAAKAHTDAQTITELRAGLASRDAELRFVSAYALAHAGATAVDSGVIDALCDAMDSPDSDRRWAATAALARLDGNPAVRARLVRVARGDSPRARRMALYSLRGLGGPHDCGIAAAALDDRDPRVRLAAIALIAGCGRGCRRCAESVRTLIHRDLAAGVRRAAAAALGKIGVSSSATIRSLRGAAASPDKAMARAAIRALELLALQKTGAVTRSPADGA
jgi:HEAT repeat protein